MALCLLGAASTGYARDTEPYSFPAKTLSHPPNLDGVISSSEWEGAERLTGLIDDNTGQSVGDQTELFVGVVPEGVYIGFTCFDSDPSGVVALTKQDGVRFQGEDFFVVVIDPLNKKDWNSVSQFRINPLGSRSEQIAGGRAAKREWTGDWKAVASKNEKGWSGEMFIPWGILNFPDGQMGDCLINFARWDHALKVESRWSPLTLRDLAERNGVMTGIQFPQKPKESTTVEMLGYFSPEYDEDADPKTSFRSGIDFRLRPNSRVTGVLSLNPDFKNIQGVVDGIGFTRSERFRAETRPFFSEGSGFFSPTSQHGIGLLFYTQRIEDFDQGIKFFGAVGDKDNVGLLATVEDKERLDAVFNYRRQIDSRSSINFFGTARSDGAIQNRVYGTSGLLSKGNWAVEHEFAISDDSGDHSQAGSFGINYEIPRFFTLLRGLYVQPDFQARLGLVPFTGYRGVYSYSEYNARYNSGPYQRAHIDLFLEDNEKFDNTNFRKSAEINANLITRRDINFGLGYSSQRFENEPEQITSARMTFNSSHPYNRFGASWNVGQRNGVYSSFVNVFASRRIAGIDFGLQQSMFRNGSTRHQTIGTVGWEIDKTRSLTARIVQNEDNSNWYLAYRNAGGKGLEWYVIVGDPNAQTTRDRVALKLVWAR